MDISQVAPALHMLTFPVGNAYLWCDGRDVTVIDTGPAGYAGAVLEAVERVSGNGAQVRRIVLTHSHADHVGSAADLAAVTATPVIAGRAEVPYIQGDQPEAVLAFNSKEHALHEAVSAHLPPTPPCHVDQAVDDGDVLPFGGGAHVLATPGHTPGSIALYLPTQRLLLTGDTVASRDGNAILGPFNVDRERAWSSLQRLADLDFDVACFGHGAPISSEARRALQAATDPFG